ncbi:MAG: helix-turn-helix domain-containing protein [Sphingomonadales bacterium]|nr:helix-turn-helix domain-containing protein [Sphingomonadales bacterium]
MTDASPNIRRTDRKFSQFVQSLERGLNVIASFSNDAPQQTLSDVAAATGISRAAARRILLTLNELEYVRFDGRLFQLTPKVLRLGYSFLSSHGFAEAAQPIVANIVKQVEESSSISILDGHEIVYIVRVQTKRIMRTAGIHIGTRLPAHATAMGRVLLSGLADDELRQFLESTPLTKLNKTTIDDKAELFRLIKKIREDGYVIVRDELELGIQSIAVPVCNGQGGVVAALNVGAQSARMSPARAVKEALPILLDSARQLQEFVSCMPAVEIRDI